MQKIIFIGLFCLLMLPASAFGHKLIPTDGTNTDYESALEIPDPVISWAMYEELEGNALFYKFDAEKDDRLFSSIVIPKLDTLENNHLAHMQKDIDRIIYIISAIGLGLLGQFLYLLTKNI